MVKLTEQEWKNLYAEMRMAPGQEPYTFEEFKAVTTIVSEAAEYDPGEENEAEVLDGKT